MVIIPMFIPYNEESKKLAELLIEKRATNEISAIPLSEDLFVILGINDQNEKLPNYINKTLESRYWINLEVYNQGKRRDKNVACLILTIFIVLMLMLCLFMSILFVGPLAYITKQAF